ncbi:MULTISPECIES: hypothetical protein [Nostocales]|uniref:Uncharacterized protein n=3 Tax=Nostocales TaxID=1161 RepID=A0A8S9T5D5_9CYAN|nr:hypothetical protein [Tolypothrix bouteillei]KAF3886822.1 hypothetical protein DA73_0400016015 [Tolypothrix bouteillei VB521301]
MNFTQVLPKQRHRVASSVELADLHLKKHSFRMKRKPIYTEKVEKTDKVGASKRFSFLIFISKQ